MNKAFCFFLLLFTGYFSASAQVLTMQEALRTALANYGTIKAKSQYVQAARALEAESRAEYLPNVSVSAQQEYGNVNGQFGPSYGYRGLAVSSAGPVMANQSWASAFGALYLTNVDWDFFAFGRARERTRFAHAQAELSAADLEQETFEHQVRVAAAYLSLLAAQRLLITQQKNLDRASALFDVVSARAKNGLNPGVDSSLAKSEVSGARIALNNARDLEAQQEQILAGLMGIKAGSGPLTADTSFVTRLPNGMTDTAAVSEANHPLLKFYSGRVSLSNARQKYFRTLSYPTFSLFGVLQDRATGFETNYGATNPYGYTHDYFYGISPSRTNYLAGIGVTWNLTTPLRVREQVRSERLTAEGLQYEYEQLSTELANQLRLSETRIRNALASFAEAPVQVKAASDAYLQKSVLYKNGLSNIVDMTTTLFTLNRAETDRDIANNNVWQALLLKAAAVGDFSIFSGAF